MKEYLFNKWTRKSGIVSVLTLTSPLYLRRLWTQFLKQASEVRLNAVRVHKRGHGVGVHRQRGWLTSAGKVGQKFLPYTPLGICTPTFRQVFERVQKLEQKA